MKVIYLSIILWRSAWYEQSRHVHVTSREGSVPFVKQVTQIYEVLGYVTQQFVDILYAIHESSRKLALA